MPPLCLIFAPFMPHICPLNELMGSVLLSSLETLELTPCMSIDNALALLEATLIHMGFNMAHTYATLNP